MPSRRCERLEQLHPNYSRLYQERGHCYVGLRQAEPAIDAFLRAVNINAALPASWKALQGLYKMTGQTANAATAAAHVEKLAELPPEVVTATTMFADGEIFPAERLIRDFLLKHGDHVEAMRLLAQIGMKLDVLRRCRAAVGRRIAPGTRLSRRAARLRGGAPAAAQARAAPRRSSSGCSQAEPDNRAFQSELCQRPAWGWVSTKRRWSSTGRFWQRSPQAADLHLSVAHALKTLGKQQEAIDSYRDRHRHKAGLRRCLLESCEPQNLQVSRRRHRADAQPGAGSRRRARRPLPPVLRAG